MADFDAMYRPLAAESAADGIMPRVAPPSPRVARPPAAPTRTLRMPHLRRPPPASAAVRSSSLGLNFVGAVPAGRQRSSARRSPRKLVSPVSAEPVDAVTRPTRPRSRGEAAGARLGDGGEQTAFLLATFLNLDAFSAAEERAVLTDLLRDWKRLQGRPASALAAALQHRVLSSVSLGDWLERGRKLSSIDAAVALDTLRRISSASSFFRRLLRACTTVLTAAVFPAAGSEDGSEADGEAGGKGEEAGHRPPRHSKKSRKRQRQQQLLCTMPYFLRVEELHRLLASAQATNEQMKREGALHVESLLQSNDDAGLLALADGLCQALVRQQLVTVPLLLALAAPLGEHESREAIGSLFARLPTKVQRATLGDLFTHRQVVQHVLSLTHHTTVYKLLPQSVLVPLLFYWWNTGLEHGNARQELLSELLLEMSFKEQFAVITALADSRPHVIRDVLELNRDMLDHAVTYMSHDGLRRLLLAHPQTFNDCLKATPPERLAQLFASDPHWFETVVEDQRELTELVLRVNRPHLGELFALDTQSRWEVLRHNEEACKAFIRPKIEADIQREMQLQLTKQIIMVRHEKLRTADLLEELEGDTMALRKLLKSALLTQLPIVMEEVQSTPKAAFAFLVALLQRYSMHAIMEQVDALPGFCDAYLEAHRGHLRAFLAARPMMLAAMLRAEPAILRTVVRVVEEETGTPMLSMGGELTRAGFSDASSSAFMALDDAAAADGRPGSPASRADAGSWLARSPSPLSTVLASRSPTPAGSEARASPSLLRRSPSPSAAPPLTIVGTSSASASPSSLPQRSASPASLPQPPPSPRKAGVAAAAYAQGSLPRLLQLLREEQGILRKPSAPPPLAAALSTVAQLYMRKLVQDEESNRAREQPQQFVPFVYHFFLRSIGVSHIAVLEAERLVAAVERYAAESTRLRVFAQLTGILPAPSLTPLDCDLVLQLLSQVLAGAHVRQTFKMGTARIQLTVAKQALVHALPLRNRSKLGRHVNMALRDATETVEDVKLVSVDDVLDVALEGYRHYYSQSARLLRAELLALADMKATLSYDEFRTLLIHSSRSAAKKRRAADWVDAAPRRRLAIKLAGLSTPLVSQAFEEYLLGKLSLSSLTRRILVAQERSRLLASRKTARQLRRALVHLFGKDEDHKLAVEAKEKKKAEEEVQTMVGAATKKALAAIRRDEARKKRERRFKASVSMRLHNQRLRSARRGESPAGHKGDDAAEGDGAAAATAVGTRGDGDEGGGGGGGDGGGGGGGGGSGEAKAAEVAALHSLIAVGGDSEWDEADDGDVYHDSFDEHAIARGEPSPTLIEAGYWPAGSAASLIGETAGDDVLAAKMPSPGIRLD